MCRLYVGYCRSTYGDVMKVSVLIPTGARPHCFRITEQCLKSQTRQPDEVIIVDDCLPNTVCTLGEKYIRGPQIWQPHMNTQKANLLAGLKYVTGDVLYTCEDDDFYGPRFIEETLPLLEGAHIVGLGESKYYYTAIPGSLILSNFGHASLSQTAIRASLIPMLKEAILSDNFFIDIELWKMARERNIPWTLLHNTCLGVGIKNLPGRPGLTESHRSKQCFIDSGHTVLRSWLGDSVKYYIPYLKGFKIRNKAA